MCFQFANVVEATNKTISGVLELSLGTTQMTIGTLYNML
jgi:hypothetical protein